MHNESLNVVCVFSFNLDFKETTTKKSLAQGLCPVMLVSFCLTFCFVFLFPSSIIPPSLSFSHPKVHCFRSPLSPKKRMNWEFHVSQCFLFYHHPFFFCLTHLSVSLIEHWPLAHAFSFIVSCHFILPDKSSADVLHLLPWCTINLLCLSSKSESTVKSTDSSISSSEM